MTDNTQSPDLVEAAKRARQAVQAFLDMVNVIQRFQTLPIPAILETAQHNCPIILHDLDEALAAELERLSSPRGEGEVREALVDYLAIQDEDDWCQRIKYGQCSIRKCVVAGDPDGPPFDLNKATCPRWRLEQALTLPSTEPLPGDLDVRARELLAAEYEVSENPQAAWVIRTARSVYRDHAYAIAIRAIKAALSIPRYPEDREGVGDE